MNPIDNPYRPGAGRRPPLLAGRASLLDDFEAVKTRAEARGEGDRSWVLNGLRGVGKTVLLGELFARATARQWIAAKVEVGAGGPLPAALSRALTASMRRATGHHPAPRIRRLLGVLKGFSLRVDPTGAFAVGVDVDAIRGIADTGRLGDDLSGLLEVMSETARDLGIGVLILIDELQEAPEESLAAINTAVHHLGQLDPAPPVLFVGAGLPSLPAQLADATSYAERLYEYRNVGLLDPGAAREALVVPARDLEVEWNPDALETALDVARGYPYFLQAIGKHVWDAARTNVIDAEDVEVGLEAARQEVDDGLYRSRWERATPAQRDVMRALARLGGEEPAPVADIAVAAGKTRTSDISVARVELIKKGLVYAPERGLLAFTVPGMHDFVARQN
ncbi:MAG: ATP-binding protein [Actinomycetota bacterium]|nr:ATP-binding protein [Actinomycetota bacterium]